MIEVVWSAGGIRWHFLLFSLLLGVQRVFTRYVNFVNLPSMPKLGDIAVLSGESLSSSNAREMVAIVPFRVIVQGLSHRTFKETHE